MGSETCVLDSRNPAKRFPGRTIGRSAEPVGRPTPPKDRLSWRAARAVEDRRQITLARHLGQPPTPPAARACPDVFPEDPRPERRPVQPRSPRRSRGVRPRHPAPAQHLPGRSPPPPCARGATPHRPCQSPSAAGAVLDLNGPADSSPALPRKLRRARACLGTGLHAFSRLRRTHRRRSNPPGPGPPAARSSEDGVGASLSSARTWKGRWPSNRVRVSTPHALPPRQPGVSGTLRAPHPGRLDRPFSAPTFWPARGLEPLEV